MGPPEDERITRIFLEACDLKPAQRARFLDEACAGDVALREEIEALLEHDLPSSALGGVAAAASAPDSIGPYKILRVLGEGGMGAVYLAEQTEPVRRLVALKLIRAGLDTRQLIARFESERQALAMMDHPCVTKVFHAGSTAEGRPYFAMEYVLGIPITQHCDRERLTTRERLKLFLSVCDGVQHAHQKGIIHRDLKPSNVLVSIRDGKPEPKIIDFGVAKATAGPLSERLLMTELGTMIGTPEYMSPEQADPSNPDVDTRTDVYGLGVMLYELLVGVLPFDPGELRQAGYEEVRRILREVEPPKPSARLATLAKAAATSAGNRQTDPGSLRRELAGDLDWVVLRAIEKNRERRYGSASELADDIRRHLEDQPVVARPPSLAYRVSKTVRRNRLLVASVLVVATALLVGLAATTVLYRRERIARQAAIGERTVAIRESYTANLRAAQLALKSGDIRGALQGLDACPPDERGPEWGWIRGTVATERFVLRGSYPRFTGDGRSLVTLNDGIRRVWDREHGALTQSSAAERPAPNPGYETVAVNQDGSQYIVMTMIAPPFPEAARVRYWIVDANSTRVLDLGTFRSLGSTGVKSFPHWVFSKDGHYVACLGDEGRTGAVGVFDNTTGVRWRTLELTGDARSASFSTDGTRLVTISYCDDVAVWALPSGRLLGRRHLPEDGSMDSPAVVQVVGGAMAIGYEGGRIEVRDLESGRLRHSWFRHDAAVTALDLDRSGRIVVSAAEDGSVRLWNDNTSSPVRSWWFGGSVSEVALSPDGATVVASGASVSKAWLTAASSTVSLGETVTALAVSPSGQRIACGRLDRSVTILERDGLIVRKTTKEPIDNYVDYAISRAHDMLWGGRYVPIYACKYSGQTLVTGDGYGRLRVLSDSGSVVRAISVWPSPILALDVSRDGKWAAVGFACGRVTIEDLAGATPSRVVKSYGDRVMAVLLTPAGDGLVVGGTGGVSFWGLPRTEMKWSVKTHGAVTALAVDPAGHWIAGGMMEQEERRDDDSDVLVWDAVTGTQFAAYADGTPGSEILSVVSDSKGRRIIAGTLSGSVLVLRTAPFEHVVSFEVGSMVEALAITPDDSALVCGLRDGSVRILEQPPTNPSSSKASTQGN